MLELLVFEEGLTGVKASEFSRMRDAPLDRFTVDRLMTISNRLTCCVKVKVTIKPGSGQFRPDRAQRSVNAREHENRYLPRGLFLIISKNRHLCGLTVEQPLALLTSRHCRPHPKAVAAYFDRRHRVGD